MIKHQILHFIHEKIFRYDRGRMPNKFTNLIYAILMPIKYIVQHNTTMRYDFMRDVYIIEKMEFSRRLLLEIHNTPRNSLFQDERDLLWNNYAKLISKSVKGADTMKIPALNIEMTLLDEPK